MKLIKRVFKWFKEHLLESSSAIVLSESAVHSVGIIAAAAAAFVIGQYWLGLGLAGLACLEVLPASYLAYKLIVERAIAARAVAG